MITHFTLGFMVASFFTSLVVKSELGVPLMVLGGVMGLLPDFLDFKFWKFFEKWDYVVDPDPANPDPKRIAEVVAKAIDEAYEKGEVRVKLHTIQLGFDHWRRYSVEFNSEEKKIVVRIGAIVNTGKMPYPETDLNLVGEAKTKHPFIKTYPKPTEIDIFTGPSFAFKRKGDKVEAVFIPWHREWSHSFTVGALIAGVIALILGWKIGLMSMLAYWSHVISDHFSFMGSNLLWPITKERTPGFGLAESGDPTANFTTVYVATTIILKNLDTKNLIPLTPLKYYLLITILPAATLITLTIIYRRKTGKPETRQEAAAREALQEEETPFKEGID